MKKNKFSIITFLIINILLTSCESNSSNYYDNSVNENSTSDVVKENVTEINCRIFFKGDVYNEETDDFETEEIEMKKFHEDKSASFCYDNMYFDRFIIEGQGQNLTFIVNEKNTSIYKRENFSLSNEISFTAEDFNFGMGENYVLIIKQENEILFEGKIYSEGCN